MLVKIKLCIELLAIVCFLILSIIGFIQKDWNFGWGMNLALAILYVFIYLQPIR